MSADEIRVLHIEDNTGDSRLIWEALRRESPGRFAVDCVETLGRALDVLAAEPYDAVLLDLSLPDSTGAETVARLRESQPGLPIVVLTGNSDEQLGLKAVQYGADDFFVKGEIELLGSPTLSRSLHHCLERHRLIAEAQDQRSEAEASRHRFDAIVANTADGIVIVDREGTVQFANPAAGELFGRECDAMVGEPFGFPAASREPTEIELLVGGPRRRVVEMRSSTLEWGGESSFLIALRDVTARKQADEYLEEQERRQAVLAELGQRALEGVKLQELMQMAARAVAETLGVGSVTIFERVAGGEMLRLRASSGLKEDVPAGSTIDVGARSQPAHAMELGKPVLVSDWRAETRFKPPPLVVEHGLAASVSVPLPGTPEPWGVLEVHATETASLSDEDVHFVQAVANALVTAVAREQSEDELRLLWASVSRLNDMVVVAECDDSGEPETRIVFANNAFQRRTGYRIAEVLGRSLRMLEGPETEPATAARIAEALRSGESIREEVLYYTRGGESFWVELDLVPLLDEVGRRTHWVSVLRDVTERRALERQLRQAQKMEAVGQLAGGVAHDFNNLLTVIMGETELVLDGESLEAAARVSLSEIRKASERATMLTRQLLAFSRKQLVEPRVLSLGELVRDMDQMVLRLIGEDIQLKTRTKESGMVKADRGQIEQVLMNLVVNARDAMPRGGKLLIETTNVVLDEEYARLHLDVAPGEYVMLSVSDSGTGMTEEVKARIFEPFFTTKEEGRGSGLGLATCYGIVREFGGHIAAYSEIGVGTTMKVYLPRVAHDRPAKGSATQRSLSWGDETILLVEDDESVRKVTARVLRRQGYTVIEAGDAEEAMALLESHASRVDLLLTDVVLPGASGRAVAEMADVVSPGIKILFASGYTEDAILRHRLRDEGVNLLQKPFTIESLSEKVRKVLDGDA